MAHFKYLKDQSFLKKKGKKKTQKTQKNSPQLRKSPLNVRNRSKTGPPQQLFRNLGISVLDEKKKNTPLSYGS